MGPLSKRIYKHTRIVWNACRHRILTTGLLYCGFYTGPKKFVSSKGNTDFSVFLFFFFFLFVCLCSDCVFPHHFMLLQYTVRLLLYNKSLMSAVLWAGRGKRKRGADAFPLDTYCLVVLAICHASVHFGVCVSVACVRVAEEARANTATNWRDCNLICNLPRAWATVAQQKGRVSSAHCVYCSQTQASFCHPLSLMRIHHSFHHICSVYEFLTTASLV